MKSLFRLLCLAAVGAGFSAAHADVPVGLWQSVPDRQGLVMHVRTRPCGVALCGRIERAKDRRGYDTPSQAVGQQVLFDLRQSGDGSYRGQYFARDSGTLRTAILRVQGNVLHIGSCIGTACQTELWTRLR